MRPLNLFFYVIGFTSFMASAQVGVNTTEPKADLDVNGTMRIQNLVSTDSEAVKLLGVDEDGIILELDMDENIYIEGDIVKSHTRRERVHLRNVLGIPVLDNALSIIWPGGTGDGKSVIRIENILIPNTTLTGLEMNVFASPMDAHGMTVTLYSVSGSLTLNHNDPASNPENRFLLAGGLNLVVQQYDMTKLMYDGILEKWLVMSKN